MNFYKRYMGDFARDTAHLTMLERGAYNDMLDHYYATAKPLPADNSALYRIAKAMSGAERKAVDRVADAFFPVNGDGNRHNKRADIEIAKHEAQAIVNRELGKKGGRPRKTESVSESETESEPESVSEREPNHNPNHSQIPETPKSNPLSARADGVFAKFWAAYPRKTAKQAAFKAFAKLKVDEELLGVMLKSIAAHSHTDQWKRDVIPHAATWLNQRRWEDEVARSSKQVDTTCRRLLPGGDRCGMPGKPHPVYEFSCQHCDRKEFEAMQNNAMPEGVRAQLREKGVLR